jgi:hypothetical protein
MISPLGDIFLESEIFSKITPFALILLLIVSIVPTTGSLVTARADSVTGYHPRASGYLVYGNATGFFITIGDDPWVGPLKVLYVAGPPYDRGVVYGYLAGEEIYGVLYWVYYLVAQANGIPTEAFRQYLLSKAAKYEPYTPQEYLDEMRGIADGFNMFQTEYPEYSLGFNLTMYDILLINVFVDLACTGAAINGSLTVNGEPLIGTTVDAEPLAPYFMVIVEEPTSGHAITYVTVGGSLFQNGFNNAGLGMIEHHIYGWDVVGMSEMIRDRYVIQYADNVTQAIQLFYDLFNNYGFSGYGDDVSLTDRNDNIAKLEITPYKIGYIVNPNTDPTWPPEDPFLKAGRRLEPYPYIHYYTEGYDSVLRGKGWVVNGLYTLPEVVVGLPDFPDSWEEATQNESWSWIWEAPERYEIAHYIYDAQIRGDKLSLQDAVIMSRLPLVGDAPHSDGAEWFQPTLGILVMLKGQASFAHPIVLRTFYPVTTTLRENKTLSETYNNTLVLIGIAENITNLITSINKTLKDNSNEITSRLSGLKAEITSYSNMLSSNLSKLNDTLLAGFNSISDKLDQLKESQQAINNNIASLNESLQNSIKTNCNASMIAKAVTPTQTPPPTTNKAVYVNMGLLVIAIILLGALYLTKK